MLLLHKEETKALLITKEKAFWKNNKEIYEQFLKDMDTRGIKDLEEILELYNQYLKLKKIDKG